MLDSEKDLGAPKSRMKDPHEGFEGAKTLGHTKDEVETFSDTSSGTISHPAWVEVSHPTAAAYVLPTWNDPLSHLFEIQLGICP